MRGMSEKEYINQYLIAVLFYLQHNAKRADNFLFKIFNWNTFLIFYEWLRDEGIELNKVFNVKNFDRRQEEEFNITFIPMAVNEDNSVEYIFSKYAVRVADAAKLQAFLDNYLELFKANELISTKSVYSYEKQKQTIPQKWNSLYKEFGNKLSIEIKDTDAEKPYKQCELLFTLVQENFIKLISVTGSSPEDFRKGDYGNHINFNVEFLKSQSEWLSYGDLEINIQNGTVLYKKKDIGFGRTTSNQFVLLKNLVKNRGKAIPFKTIAKFLKFKDEDRETFKEHPEYAQENIEDVANRIKQKLGINNNPKATMAISFAGKAVRLVLKSTKISSPSMRSTNKK